MFTLHDDNSYISSRGNGSISRNNSFARIPDSSGIASDYPSTSIMMAWAGKSRDLRLTTDLAKCSLGESSSEAETGEQDHGEAHGDPDTFFARLS